MDLRVGTAALVAVCSALTGCGGGSKPTSSVPQAIPSAALEAGLRVSLSASASGSTVRFSAPVADDDGGPPSWSIDFGDGTSKEFTAELGACPSGGRTAATPVRTTITVSHTYAKAGSYAAQIEVTTAGPCDQPAPETQSGLALVTVG